MKPARARGRWMSVVMALVFGFMNLGHGPIMTFAHAADAAQHEAAADRSDCHEPDAGHHAAAGEAQACNAFGCFITVGPPLVGAPPAELMPIGKLGPAPPRAGLPANSEPADPPPRLHA